MFEEKLINLSDLDKPIYRVLDSQHLLNLFKTGDLLFTRPSKWEDPFENCLLKLNTVQKSTGEKIGLRGLLDIFFGLCWSLGAKETDATWRIYSPNRNGVRISTTIRKLLLSLNHHENFDKNKTFFVGKVRYMSVESIITHIKTAIRDKKVLSTYDGKSLADLLLLKRVEFAHEKECRILYSDPGKTIAQYEPRYSFKIDPFTLIDQIVFDPRIPDYHYEHYVEQLRWSGVKAPISQSQLYQLPSATIEIGD